MPVHNNALHIEHEFFHDVMVVLNDELRHFNMLSDRLRELGSEYGALPGMCGIRV